MEVVEQPQSKPSSSSSSTYLNLSPKSPVYIVAVPRCHENLFQIIKDNHQFLSSGGHSFLKPGGNRERVYPKKINTDEDFKKLENIITALRTEKSELFIDPEYHPKPASQKVEEYISEFLRNKSVGNYYTFKSYYRITVFPTGFDYTVPVPPAESEPEQRYRCLDLFDQRREYLIVPLFIILKRGKTYEQMKTLSYNPDGTFTVNKVNPHHFWKLDDYVQDDQVEIDKKNKEMKEKVMRSLP